MFPYKRAAIVTGTWEEPSLRLCACIGKWVFHLRWRPRATTVHCRQVNTGPVIHRALLE